MRILSQDRTMDIPYEQINILRDVQSAEGHNSAYIIYAQTSDSCYVIATYSTESKAQRAIEMLHKAFNDYEWIRRTGSSKETISALTLVSNEQFNKITSVYFQFPSDDEIGE